jgi:hypothetical protein
MSDGDTPNIETTAQIVRDLLNHESEVVHHRMSWFGTFQGFLFAAAGVAWKAPHSKGLLVTFCCLGFAVSAFSWVALFMANLATRDLIRWWNSRYPDGYDGPPVIGFRSPGVNWARLVLTPWLLTVLAFGLAWVAIFVIALSFGAQISPKGACSTAQPISEHQGDSVGGPSAYLMVGVEKAPETRNENACRKVGSGPLIPGFV